jgi:hypothetical protein
LRSDDAPQVGDQLDNDTEEDTVTEPVPQADYPESETESAADAELDTNNSNRSSLVAAPRIINQA